MGKGVTLSKEEIVALRDIEWAGVVDHYYGGIKMDQLLEVLLEIRDGIYAMNSNIEGLITSVEELKGTGLYNSISDVYDKLESISTTVEEIKGSGLYNSLSDVCEKLDSVTESVESISVHGVYNLQDVCNKLDSIDTNTM